MQCLSIIIKTDDSYFKPHLTSALVHVVGIDCTPIALDIILQRYLAPHNVGVAPHVVGVSLPSIVGVAPHIVGVAHILWGLPPCCGGYPPRIVGLPPHILGVAPPTSWGLPPHVVGVAFPPWGSVLTSRGWSLWL